MVVVVVVLSVSSFSVVVVVVVADSTQPHRLDSRQSFGFITALRSLHQMQFTIIQILTSFATDYYHRREFYIKTNGTNTTAGGLQSTFIVIAPACGGGLMVPCHSSQ